MKAKAWRPFAPLLICLITHPLTAAPQQRFVSEYYPDTLNSNSLPIVFQVEGEAPEWMAVVVQWSKSIEEQRAEWEAAMAKWRSETKTNRNVRMPSHPNLEWPAFDEATWIPFQTNLLVDLGPGDGQRSINFGYKYAGQTRCDSWTGSSVTVQTELPRITIVNPTNFVTSQPMIQLQGVSTHELSSVRYDRYNEKGEKVVNDAQGYAGGTFGTDTKFRHLHGRSYFTCFDVDLSPGTNTFVLRCSDDAGNSITTNLVILFTTEGDTTAPSLDLHWPRPGHRLLTGSLTARGLTDDPTAIMSGQIIANGHTNAFEGFAERNGYFWFEEIPLGVGANELTLTATDVAGNVASTNLQVYGVEGTVITMDPVEPNTLWDSHVNLKGTVTPPAHDVWINGVRAKVNSDGGWTAEKVPVKSPNGGTAVFEMTAIPVGKARGSDQPPMDLVRMQADLGTNAMVLNASSPACGIFQLHLSGTEGRGFVLFASTNLLDWTPLLTNSCPEATFDYTDADTTNHACRFFKIVPLR